MARRMRIQPLAATSANGGTVLRYRPRTARRVASFSVLVVEDDAADTSLIIEAWKARPDVCAAHTWDSADGAQRLLAAARDRSP
jgi:hypothetical protein